MIVSNKGNVSLIFITNSLVWWFFCNYVYKCRMQSDGACSIPKNYIPKHLLPSYTKTVVQYGTECATSNKQCLASVTYTILWSGHSIFHECYFNIVSCIRSNILFHIRYNHSIEHIYQTFKSTLKCKKCVLSEYKNVVKKLINPRFKSFNRLSYNSDDLIGYKLCFYWLLTWCTLIMKMKTFSKFQ